jgi:regulatory protein
MKQWGRIKIKYELKQKKINDYVIKKAFKEIDELDYTTTLKKLTITKWNSLKQEQYINRQVKTTNYLLQKGFELNLIKEAIANIQSK